MSTYFQVDTSSAGAWWISGGLGDGLERVGQVPGQQLLDATDGVIGDLGEHRAQIELCARIVERAHALPRRRPHRGR